MVNLWGPGAHGAARPAAVRPNFVPDNAPGDADDFYQDCSSPTLRDGTEWKSAALNAMLVNMRGVVRATGTPDDNLDDLLLARAIQSGGMNWAVATGTANAWVVALGLALNAYNAGRPLYLRAPATNTSAVVNANVSGLGDRRIKKADGADPAIGDLILNRWYPTIDDGVNILVLTTLPSDVAAQKALVNLQTRITSTRQNMVGDAGNSYTVTAWTPTAYVKQSPTSKLVLWLAANSLTPGAAGASAARLTVGAATPIESVASNAQPATSAGPTVIQREILGLAAGSHSLALAYRRYDATAWNTVFCPTSADAGYLPATSTATLIIGEVEP